MLSAPTCLTQFTEAAGKSVTRGYLKVQHAEVKRLLSSPSSVSFPDRMSCMCAAVRGRVSGLEVTVRIIRRKIRTNMCEMN